MTKNEALDKKAENARELGLDYEPWKPHDTAHRPGGLPQDFIKHEVKNEGDWSEWVNPYSEQYFMKCCDCGLVHEMQFKVVKYSEGNECDFVDDPDLQPVFRARRATTPAQPAPVQEPVRWTDEEYREISDQVISTLVEYGAELRAADCQMQILREDLAESRREVAQLKAQRQWVGLTDEEKRQIFEREDYQGWLDYINAIEAKLRSKNT